MRDGGRVIGRLVFGGRQRIRPLASSTALALLSATKLVRMSSSEIGILAIGLRDQGAGNYTDTEATTFNLAHRTRSDRALASGDVSRADKGSNAFDEISARQNAQFVAQTSLKCAKALHRLESVVLGEVSFDQRLGGRFSTRFGGDCRRAGLNCQRMVAAT